MLKSVVGWSTREQEESEMNATTVAVDLAKNVFQLAVADASWKVVESHRLTRTQFERFFANRDVRLVIMEACGSVHHWARWLNSREIEVKLLPAAYVRAYLRRNKTDAADASALLEAARCAEIVPVRVKSVEQQALQGLHRVRSLWMGNRTARINTLRGLCREFGLALPQGARTGVEATARALADPNSPLPALIRGSMKLLVEEIRLLEQPVEVSLDLFLDPRFPVFGRADIERAAADNHGGIVVEVQAVRDAESLDAHSARVVRPQSAIFQETAVFAVGGRILRSQLQDQYRPGRAHGRHFTVVK